MHVVLSRAPKCRSASRHRLEYSFTKFLQYIISDIFPLTPTAAIIQTDDSSQVKISCVRNPIFSTRAVGLIAAKAEPRSYEEFNREKRTLIHCMDVVVIRSERHVCISEDMSGQVPVELRV